MNDEAIEIMERNGEKVKETVNKWKQQQVDIGKEIDSSLTLACSAPLHSFIYSFGSPLPSSPSSAPISLVIGSYILYDPDCFQPIVDSIIQINDNWKQHQQDNPLDVTTQSQSPSVVESSSFASFLSSRPLYLFTSHESTREARFLSLIEGAGLEWWREDYPKEHIDSGEIRKTGIILIRNKSK